MRKPKVEPKVEIIKFERVTYDTEHTVRRYYKDDKCVSFTINSDNSITLNCREELPYMSQSIRLNFTLEQWKSFFEDVNYVNEIEVV